MTLAELRIKLRRSIGNPDTSQVSDALLTEIINAAYEEMCDEFQFRSTRPLREFSTIADVDKYELDSRETMILRLWDQTEGQERRLKRFDMREFAEAGGQSADRGAPVGYIRVQNYLQIVPMPDAAYDLAYYAKMLPEPLAADDDVPDVPIAWHIGIWRNARYHYWDDAGDIAKAQYSYNNYRLWAQRKTDEWADELANEMEDGGPIPALVVRRHTDNSTRSFEIND